MLFIFFAALLGESGIDPTVQAALDRQQASLGMVWALEMDIDAMAITSGEVAGDDKPIWHYHWAKSATKERQHYEAVAGVGKDKDGNPSLPMGDVLDDGVVRRVLVEYDLRKSPPIDGRQPGKVRAQLKPVSRIDDRRLAPFPLASFLLQGVRIISGDSLRTIPEFLKEASSVTYRIDPTSSDVEIIADHPDTVSGGPFKGCKVSLLFERAKGGLVSRQIITRPTSEFNTALVIDEKRVTKWFEPKPGIFIPKEVTGNSTAPDFPPDKRNLGGQRLIARNIKYNEAVSDAAFDLVFPANVIVVDTTNPSEVKYHVWGTGDKPAETTTSLTTLTPPQDSNASTSWQRFRGWVPFAGFGIVLATVLLIWFRRRMNKS